MLVICLRNVKFMLIDTIQQVDGSLLDQEGNITGYIKRAKNYKIKPFYARTYYNNSMYQQMINNLPNISCHKILAFIGWCAINTLIRDSDLIFVNLDSYKKYCIKYGLKPISRAGYYKALKVLINEGVIKHDKEDPKSTFRINFAMLANGTYQQSGF